MKLVKVGEPLAPSLALLARIPSREVKLKVEIEFHIRCGALLPPVR